MTVPTLLRSTRRNSPADTAHALVAGDKGLLAIDESVAMCNKRFARRGITQDEQTRRAYRELIMTAPGLGDSITGPRKPTQATPQFEQADAHHEH